MCIRDRCHIIDLRYMDIKGFFNFFLSVCLRCLTLLLAFMTLVQALSVRNFGNGFLGWLILFSVSSVFAGVVERMFCTLFHAFFHDLFSSKILL